MFNYIIYSKIASFNALLIACSSALICASAQAAPPWQRVSFGEGAQAYDFPLYANRKLDGNLVDVKRVIVVLHGLQRNGDDYFDAAFELLKTHGDELTTLLIAPTFPGKPDVESGKKGFTHMPVWSVQGWIGGEGSLNDVSTMRGLSSLQVLDDVLLRFTDKSRLPKLEQLVVAGHSGGGQILHRYAVLNNVFETISARGIAVQTVVANPSSYLYFNAERPVAFDKTACPNFNDFKFGMDKPVPYAKQADTQALAARFAQRKVAYLVGSADNDPNHRVLDKSCAAEAQGAHRNARARAYVAHERGVLKQPLREVLEVQGVDHDQARMLGSQCGVRLLFGAVATNGAVCLAY